MASTDPTHTKTLRTQYGQRLRGQLGSLNAAIREGFVEDDVLQLQNAPKPPEDQEVYRFPTDRGKIRGFMDWLRRQLQRGFLSVVTPEKNVFIQAAYEQGVGDARKKLTADTPEPDFNLPAHQRALRELYTRSYELLQDVSRDMSQEIRDELVEGMRDGDHSSKIAREISDRVQKVGKHRATLISRTEVINAYTEGSLQQYEQVDVEGVTIEAEVLTAQDERVCEICKTVAEMGAFSLTDLRNEKLEVKGRVVTAKPPIHPRCRCTVLPIR